MSGVYGGRGDVGGVDTTVHGVYIHLCQQDTPPRKEPQ
nr:MAG TPA: hypothetical protein [Caudoviricetes sp.]